MIFGFKISMNHHGLGMPIRAGYGAWSASVVFIALPLIYWQAHKETYWEHYPELKGSTWTRKMRLSNAISWIVYLFAYELLFRGVLLMTLDAWLGHWAAISVMAAMYILSHVDKAREETFGSIPMSILFAWAALGTNSIWLPWIMHCSIAIASDSFSMRANPKIKCVP